MKTHSRKFRAWVLVSILSLSGLFGVVTSDHSNQGIPSFPGFPQASEGSDSRVAAAVEQARQAYEAKRAELDTLLWPMPSEPQVPAVFFRDGFEHLSSGEDARVGGWGSWSVTSSTPGSSWEHHVAAASEGANGYRFWDSANGYYPIDDAAVTDYFLVSPRINLDSMPLDAENIPGQSRTDIGPSTGFNIFLSLDHRYNFALQTTADGVVSGRDGGRLEVYTSAPTPQTLGVQGTPLVPIGTELPTNAFGGANAFSGQQPTVQQETYNLNVYAGQDVWLVFHAAVSPTARRSTYFLPETPRFPQALPFYGWMIDNLTLEGPAYLHNILVDEVLHPVLRADDGPAGLLAAAPGDNQPRPAAVYLNRGQVTETVTPRFTLSNVTNPAEPSGPLPCPPRIKQGGVDVEITTLRMRPGETQRVEFGCASFSEGSVYGAVFEAQLPDEKKDLHPSDDRASLTFIAKRGLHIGSTPVGVEPQTGRDSVARSVSITVQNTGFARENVRVWLQIIDSAGADVTNSTDVTFVSPSAFRDLSIEPKQEVGLEWTVFLKLADTYNIFVRGFEADRVQFTQRTSAATLVSLAPLFVSGAKEPTDVCTIAPECGAWQTIRLEDQKPPTAGPVGSNEYYWELSNTAPGNSNSGVTSWPLRRLIGQADGTRVGAQDQYVGIRVEVEQYLLLRCSTRKSHGLTGPSDCAFASPTLTSYVQFRPEAARYQTGGLSGAVTLFTTSANGGPNMIYYTGQWVTESYTVSAAQLTGAPGQGAPLISGAAVANLELGFLETVQGPLCNNGLSPNLNCPIWRIHRAKVEAVAADGTRTMIMRTTGIPGEEIGAWSSFQEQTGNGCPPLPICNPPCSADPACGWTRRPMETLGAQSPSLWTRYDPDSVLSLSGANGRFWTTSNPSTLTTAGQDRRIDLLVSPSLRIPADAPDPTLTFQHKFNFIAPNLRPTSDSGALMLRLLQEDGQWSPFYPIALPPYTGDDCAYYSLGDACYYDRSTDPPGTHPFRTRTPFLERLSLSAIPFWNFTGGAGGIQTFDSKGQTMQIAWRFDAGQDVFQGGSRATLHNANNVGNVGPAGSFLGQGDGWALGEVRVTATNLPGHELALIDSTLEADYDWDALGLAPGTRDLRLNVSIQNNGIYEEASTDVTVRTTFHRVDAEQPDIVTNLDLPESAVLLPGEATTASLVLDGPETAGTYQVWVEAVLAGTLPGGQPISDENPSNNCASIDSAHTPVLSCDLSGAQAIVVRETPGLSLELEVSPLSGRSDFPRDFRVTLENTGNTVLQGVELQRVIQRFSADNSQFTETETWTLAKTPAANRSATWDTLKISPTPLVSRPLGVPGLYSVSFQASGSGVSAVDSVFIDGFDNLYADTFEPRGRDESIFMRGGAAPNSSAWNIVRRPDAGSGDERAWHFGDAATGKYPPDADVSLEFPPLDLSALRLAVASFSHNYSFEPGFDGGRIEASTDNGGTWFPLTPDAGTIGTVAPSNPFNAEHDPSAAAPAWTGDSEERSPATNGWVNEEFNLGNVPAFVSHSTLKRFVQDGYDSNVPPRVGLDPRSRSESWVVDQGSCPDSCWYRDNVNLNLPVNRTGKPYWYSDSGNGAQHSAPVRLTTQIPSDLNVAEGEGVRLSYWLWRQPGSYGWPVVSYTSVEAGADGWEHYTLPLLSASWGQVATFNFVFDSGGLGGSGSKPEIIRGMVLDDVRLQYYKLGDGGQLEYTRPDEVFPTTSAAWSVPLVKPNGANWDFRNWQAVDRAPAAPEAWRVEVQSTRRAELGTVWQFGAMAGAKLDYPANTRERLESPVISLRGLGGRNAELTFWEHYDSDSGDKFGVSIQVRQVLPTGEFGYGPWQSLRSTQTGLRTLLRTDPACETTTAWCKATISLNDFIGREIKIGFDATTTRGNGAVPGNSPGYHWWVDEVAIQGDALVGDKVRLRLRAATDHDGNEGGWSVDNFQVVGLSYERNLAILPSDPRTDRVVQAGEFRLTGLIRNLSPKIWLDSDQVRFQATVQALSAGAQTVTPTVSIVAPAGAGEPRGPLILSRAGAPQDRDRIPYDVRISFPPETPPNSVFRIQMGLQEPTPFGARTLVDNNLGDHERQIIVRVLSSYGYEIQNAFVDTPTVGPGEPVVFGFELRNSGTTAIGGTIVGSVRSLALDSVTGLPNIIDLPSMALESVSPEATTPIRLEWSAGAKGFYALNATYYSDFAGAPISIPIGYVLVGDSALLYRETFEAVPEPVGWTHGAAPGGVGSTDEWQTTRDRAYDGDQSYHAGPPSGSQSSYEPGQSSFLESPPIDLTSVVDPINSDNTVMRLNFNFHYRRGLGQNDGVAVQARVLNPDGSYKYPGNAFWLDANYNGDVLCTQAGPTCNPLAGSLLPAKNPGANGRRPAYVGASEQWQVGSAPLAGRPLDTGLTLNRLLGEQVVLGFRFGSDQVHSLVGFTADSLSISAYDSIVEPATQSLNLRAGADKLLYLKVTNTGDARDSYSITLNPVLTSLPGKFKIEIMTPKLALEARASALVPIRLTTPTVLNTDLNRLPIVLDITSDNDTNRITQARITLDQVRRTRLPDLRPELQIAQGKDSQITEGTPLTLFAKVYNTGSRISRATDLIIYAQPKDCLTCDVEVLQTMPVLALPPDPNKPGHAAFFTWTPKIGHPGDYDLVAVVDPEAKHDDVSRTNNVYRKAIQILPFAKPDLLADPVSFQVLDANGQRVDVAMQGQLLRITGRVRNIGVTDAHDVEVRLVNQVTLARERRSVLAPNQEIAIETQWIAQAGNWVVRLEATLAEVEDTKNNVQTWILAVRKGELLASMSPAMLHLDPGQTAEVRLDLENHHDSEIVLASELASGSEVSIQNLPPSITLVRGISASYPLLVTASPFAPTGSQTVTVSFKQGAAEQPLATVGLNVVIGLRRDLAISWDPIIMTPGISTAELRITNQGAANDQATIQATAPPGWQGVVAPSTIRLAPAANAIARLLLETPPLVAAGTYIVAITADNEIIGRIPVEVLPHAAWKFIQQSTREIGEDTQLVVLIENTGNAAGVPDISALLGDQIEVRALDPRPAAMEPGVTQRFLVTVPSASRIEATPSSAHSLNYTGPARTGPRALELLSWDTQPRHNIQEGDSVRLVLHARNPTPDVVDAVVRAYVDGALVAERSARLDPNAESAISLSWRATGGGHVAFVAVGDPAAGIGRALTMDVQGKPAATVAAPEIGTIIILLAAAVFLMRRRTA